jgi:hypothetical protein
VLDDDTGKTKLPVPLTVYGARLKAFVDSDGYDFKSGDVQECGVDDAVKVMTTYHWNGGDEELQSEAAAAHG